MCYRGKFVSEFLILFLFITGRTQLPGCNLSDTLKVNTSTGTSIDRSLIAPGILVAATLITLPETSPINKYKVQKFVRSEFPDFRTYADDFLWAAPVVATFVLHFTPVKAKNDLLNSTILIVKSQLLAEILVQPVKYATKVLRPDSSSRNSFPSGHTARAFAAAKCFHKEFGENSIWYSIGGYSVAASVGILRILNNRHWITDVLAGAAAGIVATEIAYGTHQYKWMKKNMTVAWIPVMGKSTFHGIAILVKW